MRWNDNGVMRDANNRDRDAIGMYMRSDWMLHFTDKEVDLRVGNGYCSSRSWSIGPNQP